MKTALVAGATGLIGVLLTEKLLTESTYNKVYILVRKKLPLAHPKLKQLIFDYDHPDASALKADDVFCCLGTTIAKAKTKDAFRKVDYSYPVLLAKLAKANGAKQFALVSSLGAKKGSSNFYYSVKGDTEEALKDIGFDSLLIFRPSMLLGDRKESRRGEVVAKAVMQALSFLIPKKYRAIQADKVADSMLKQMQLPPSGVRVIESGEMQ